MDVECDPTTGACEFGLDALKIGGTSCTILEVVVFPVQRFHPQV
jgi:hypothetical protein